VLVIHALLIAAEAPSVEGFSVGQILSTGMVGVFLLMMIFRIKIMQTWVYDEAKKEWERERGDLKSDVVALKADLAEATAVYTTQVIPTLTRVLDSERELVGLRKAEEDRRNRGG